VHGREFTDSALHCCKRLESGEVDLAQAEPRAKEVHVRIVEAGHDGAAAGVDHVR
jgi:hypothetical protein